MRHVTLTHSTNILLAALPPSDHARVLSQCHAVELDLRVVVSPAGQHPDHAYFPSNGFFSVVTVLDDGAMVEIASIGREGALGIMATEYASPPVTETMVQGAMTDCCRMPIAAFHAEMARRGAFHDVMMRYLAAYFDLVAISAGCNATHLLDQRFARWLLMAHDRMNTSSFPLTQEFAAMMLGASRPTVTMVAGSFQKSGLITYRRGFVTIVDRASLEATACGCYRASRALFERPASAAAVPSAFAR